MEERQLLNESLSELPSEVIRDILCRLPIKTCQRCKLVCKDWYDIITSPHFADLRRSYSSRLVTLLLYCYLPNARLNFLMLELDKKSSIVHQMGHVRVSTDCMMKFKSKFDVPNGKLFVVNVCNGLVCLKSGKKWGCYYICNLLTSRFLMVKQVQPRFHHLYAYVLGCCPIDAKMQYDSHISRNFGDFDVDSLIYGSKQASCVGSRPMTHQFKVLRILKTRTEYVAEILTLGSDKWRQIPDAPKSSYKFQAFLNGSSHWYDHWDDECNMWAFHFGTEKFLRIPTPVEFKVRREAALAVFDSCLCFCCVYGNSYSEREVWLMKEYGAGHSWVRQLVIHVPEPLWYGPYKPLARMDDGRILISRWNSCIALYDPETRAYKEVKVNGASNIQRLEAYDADFSWMSGGVQRERSSALLYADKKMTSSASVNAGVARDIDNQNSI
ncbi:hypothetical protein Cgig2_027600 [Carnegiea gigantea]|uniref:F-box domain-containing protein n=1 Tax=Carnegiea gigantea TaxID=171969 RepID=A0A9Q1K651_9CARY|nr:hypothetical protein Cgig2_027600 [Carnegiea gigantea]